MTFDLQTIWTAGGQDAFALVVGVLLGFAQSLIPAIPATGVLRNWSVAIVAGALVGMAAITSGHTISEPNAAGNVLNGLLVFIGTYTIVLGGHTAAVKTAVTVAPDAATPISKKG